MNKNSKIAIALAGALVISVVVPSFIEAVAWETKHARLVRLGAKELIEETEAFLKEAAV